MPFKESGLLGPYSGRIGDLVIYQRKGQTIVRTRSTRKQKPQSSKQRQASERFSMVMKWMKAIKPFISIGFRDAASDGRSTYNQAMSVNLNRLYAAENPDDLQWLLPSYGTRAGAQHIQMQRQGDSATITWGNPTPLATFSDDDLAIVMAVNANTLAINKPDLTARRGHHTITIKLPGTNAGDKILVYIFFYDAGSTSRKPNLRHVSEALRVSI
jgi:hypothetical protein